MAASVCTLSPRKSFHMAAHVFDDIRWTEVLTVRVDGAGLSSLSPRLVRASGQGGVSLPLHALLLRTTPLSGWGGGHSVHCRMLGGISGPSPLLTSCTHHSRDHQTHLQVFPDAPRPPGARIAPFHSDHCISRQPSGRDGK